MLLIQYLRVLNNFFDFLLHRVNGYQLIMFNAYIYIFVISPVMIVKIRV